jgi:hypothetical protein
MTDPNEIRALKASFGGVLTTASELAAVQSRVEGLEDSDAIDSTLLEDLARLTAAHAVASAALRGLVNTMQTRRGAAASA